MRKIAVMGITGSIGLQTLDVVEQHPTELSIVALSAWANIDLLKKILTRCQPKLVCVQLASDAYLLKKLYNNINFVSGEQGLIDIATYVEADLIVNALVGFVGLKPT